MNMQFRVLAILFLSLTIWSCENQDSEMFDNGVSKELADYRSNSLQNLRYNLHFTIPLEKRDSIIGKEIINIEITDLSEPLVLDFKAPEDYLRKVIVNGLEVEYVFEKEHVIIDQENLREGENSIELAFRVGETSLNRNPEFLYTLFVPDRARTAFPCFDQPNLKGKYSLTLTIPNSWVAITNGSLINESRDGENRTLSFDETKPLSTYLFDFVAGKFEVVEREIEGKTMTMLHRETDSIKVARNLDEIFELHKKSLNWLEEYTGIEYPFKKFGFAIIPSFQYGGMEHPGAITYKASSLFLDESATQNKLMGRASLIAHETAHMWFGDLVTMDWFDDVWMKEVFANFMAAKIVNPSFPEVNHDLRFLLAHYPSAYAVDRSKGTHAIQQPLANLKDAGTLYGAIIYQKAPIVMRQLEMKISKEVMQRGLQMYLTDFAYANATWDDLISILDSVSEEKVTNWSNQWVKSAGMPTVTPYMRTRKDSTIKQFSLFQHKLSDTERHWSQELSVGLEAEDSMYHFKVEISGNGTDIEEADGLKNATFLVCNEEGYGYGYFGMGPLTKNRWLEKMQEFEDPVLRGVGWLNLWEAFLRQRIASEDLLTAILSNLQSEPDPLIQQYLLGRLSNLYWKFMHPDIRFDNAQKIEDLLWNRIETLSDSKLKSAYLSSYRSIVLTDQGIDKLYSFWNKELEVEGITFSENDYTQMAYQLALKGRKDYNEILDEQILRIDNLDRKARMEFMKPALSDEQVVRDQFFESLKSEENREQESWVQQAVGFLHHPLRAKQSEKYIRPSLEMLEEIQQTGDIFFPKRFLDNTFSGHQSPEAVDNVRQFLFRNNHYPANLKNKILQASDLTFRAAEMLTPKMEDKADQ